MVDRERGNGVQSKKEKCMVRERKRDGEREQSKRERERNERKAQKECQTKTGRMAKIK